MSFALSKILWSLLAPGSLLFLLLLGAWILLPRAPRSGRALVGLALAGSGALMLLPLTHWIVGPLEQRFPIPPLPPHVDGIVVLGGAILPYASQLAGQPQLGGAGERITAAVALSRRYPNARLLFSGGSGALRDQVHREADIAGPLFEALGVEPERILLERDSRNTWENALLSKQLAQPKPGETWLLVTSAWHMPRAVGCFRMAGWNLLPYPVDYIAGDAHWFALSPDDTLAGTTVGLKEWLGLLAYHLMHRTDAWFPAPQDAQPTASANGELHDVQ